jgi:hypothetical protein
MVSRHLGRLSLIEHIKEQLEIQDVADMSPETLGRIMGSLELFDVNASKDDLLRNLHFGGDCETMFRELVAICLAYAIAGRFEPDDTRMNDVPAYRRTKEARIGSHR